MSFKDYFKKRSKQIVSPEDIQKALEGKTDKLQGKVLSELFSDLIFYARLIGKKEAMDTEEDQRKIKIITFMNLMTNIVLILMVWFIVTNLPSG